MIEIDFDHIDWGSLSDEEQQELCKAVISEFERFYKPLYQMIMASAYYKLDGSHIGVHMFHDWFRLRNNLRAYCDPDIYDENKSLIRWQTLLPLYHVCGLLEYLNALVIHQTVPPSELDRL